MQSGPSTPAATSAHAADTPGPGTGVSTVDLPAPPVTTDSPPEHIIEDRRDASEVNLVTNLEVGSDDSADRSLRGDDSAYGNSILQDDS